MEAHVAQQAAQNAAEMARLQASLANATAQQRMDIGAEMVRVRQQARVVAPGVAHVFCG